jgi:LacI family transcriptional regulator
VDRVSEESDHLRDEHQESLSAFRSVAAKRGWSLLAVAAVGRTTDEVMQQLSAARACGIVVSGLREIAVEARRMGLPCVAVDWWEEDLGLDAVLQDDFQGGVLAARHLVRRGHTRIAWLGHTTGSHHSMARLGGANMELMREGQALAPDLCIPCDRYDVREKAKELLSRRKRPTAVLALWRRIAVGLLEAARELGLRPGEDFEMVGWSREAEYRRDYVPAFGDEPAQPAVVWSAAQMAEIALERLAARRTDPDMPPVRMLVPVWVEEDADENGE